MRRVRNGLESTMEQLVTKIAKGHIFMCIVCCFFFVILSNNVDVVKRCHSQDANQNWSYDCEQSFQKWKRSDESNIEMVNMLIKAGADINTVPKEGCELLDILQGSQT